MSAARGIYGVEAGMGESPGKSLVPCRARDGVGFSQFVQRLFPPELWGSTRQGCSAWAGGCPPPVASGVGRLMRAQGPLSCQHRHVHPIKGSRKLAQESQGVFQSHPKFSLGLISQFCPVNRD